MTPALVRVLMKLISNHGITKGPRIARKLGFSTKSIQKAFKQPPLVNYPYPDGRKLRYANIDWNARKTRAAREKADVLKWYEDIQNSMRQGKSIDKIFE